MFVATEVIPSSLAISATVKNVFSIPLYIRYFVAVNQVKIVKMYKQLYLLQKFVISYNKYFKFFFRNLDRLIGQGYIYSISV
jgi:hypothetical protein